jgi:hypothetical protein
LAILVCESGNPDHMAGIVSDRSTAVTWIHITVKHHQSEAIVHVADVAHPMVGNVRTLISSEAQYLDPSADLVSFEPLLM